MNETITIDGVIYSENKRVLIKYLEEKHEERFYVPDFIEEIGVGCFSNTNYTKHIFIGKNVKKIRERALGDQFKLVFKQIYIPGTVTELEGEIFDQGVDDGGDYYSIEIVGGERGSAIEWYCNERGIPFVVFDSSEIETFYSLSVDELKDLARRQSQESEWVIDESEKGYKIHFSVETLTFTSSVKITDDTIIMPTRIQLNRFRREMVKNVIIGDGITEIADFAFDDYENLETVFIGADVCKISSTAFTGREHGDSFGCPKLATFIVDENNKWYKSIAGVLHTFDMQTIVAYPPGKPELYYEIASCVKNIGAQAFKRANNLQCLKVGANCEIIGELAFLNAFSLRHVYFASKAIKWPEYFPFIEMVGYDRPYRLGIIFGGPKDSELQQKCNDEVEHFLVIEDDDVDDFLATPVPSKNEDKYTQECLKKMIISNDGVLEQVGEFEDELILPEGVVATRYRINLSGCKRVVIPSTMEHLWTEGFDGPASNLAEFKVSSENKEFCAIAGHLLCKMNLITYAPGAENYGVIPEGTLAVCEEAFRLIPSPFEKLYIPSSLSEIQPQYVRGGWFYEAEVSPDNVDFKAIDGSIYTIDGKALVRAKISMDGFVVPEGTEAIFEGALYDVRGDVAIPATVKEIEDADGFIGNIKRIVTPKGSFAEWYVMNNKRMFPIEIVYDGEVDPYEPVILKAEWISLSDFSGELPF